MCHQCHLWITSFISLLALCHLLFIALLSYLKPLTKCWIEVIRTSLFPISRENDYYFTRNRMFVIDFSFILFINLRTFSTIPRWPNIFIMKFVECFSTSMRSYGLSLFFVNVFSLFQGEMYHSGSQGAKISFGKLLKSKVLVMFLKEKG